MTLATECARVTWGHRIGLSGKYDNNHRAIPELRTRRDLVYVVDLDRYDIALRGAEGACETESGMHYYFSRRPSLMVRRAQDPRFIANACIRGYWSECLFLADGTPRPIYLIRGKRKVFRYASPETPVEWHVHFFQMAQERIRKARVEGGKLDAWLD